LPFWVAKTSYIYCLGGYSEKRERGKGRNRIGGVHLAQGREKREKGKENSKIKAGKRQRNNKGG